MVAVVEAVQLRQDEPEGQGNERPGARRRACDEADDQGAEGGCRGVREREQPPPQPVAPEAAPADGGKLAQARPKLAVRDARARVRLRRHLVIERSPGLSVASDCPAGGVGNLAGMRLEGTREFAARREAVFAALTDPDLVAGAIPALESLEVADVGHWTATVKVPIAPRLRVAFEILERRPPEHARLRARGKNLGGGATLDTSFDLAGQNGSTTMHYDARFALSGLLGRLGEHALRPIAERQVERLMRAVERRVDGGA
jgi:carbon monoxide dehydrogenase subunit G